MTRGIEAVETWMGWLNDEDLEYKTAPCESSQYYTALSITMCMIAMEAMENAPLEMLRFTEGQMEMLSKYFFDGDDKRATEFLMDIRKNWRPNIVPVWDVSSGEDADPKVEIDEEDAKFHHLTVLKGSFEQMKRLAATIASDPQT